MLRKLTVAALVVGVASTGFAIQLPNQLPGGHVRIQSLDNTSIYDAEGEPLPPNSLPGDDWEGCELRSIFHAQVIGGVPGQGAQIGPGQELTGTITGIVVTDVTALPPQSLPSGETLQSFVVNYAPKPLSQPLTDVDSPANAVPMAGGQAGGGAGGRVTLYLDNTPDYSPAGPGDWVASTYDADSVPRLEYPTAGLYESVDPLGNGVLDLGVEVFMDAVLAPLSWYDNNPDNDGDPTVMSQVLTYMTGGLDGQAGFLSGSAEAFINSIRNNTESFGDYSDVLEYTRLSLGLMLEDWAGRQPPWSSNPSALYGDAYLYTLLGSPSLDGGWMFTSLDTLDYARVPEPATCVLVGGALLALARRRKRRR